MSTSMLRQYYRRPVRIMIRTRTGYRTRYCWYDAIARAREAGVLVAAWSTSTGKALA